MRSGFLLIAAGLTGATGCSLARNAVHNLANETAAHWDERKLSRQLRAEADAAWTAYCLQAGGALTDDFAAGFRDGYADYLESGGNGSPPAVPPLRYRRSGYLNPEGHARIREYFAGFKAGMDTAVVSGHRQYLTVPVLLADERPPAPLPGTQLPAARPLPAATPVTPTAPMVRAGEKLPTPRPMGEVADPPAPAPGLPIPERPLVKPLPPAVPPVPFLPPVPPPGKKIEGEGGDRKGGANPPEDPFRPIIPVVPPPQSRLGEPPTIGQPIAIPVSVEVPVISPGSPAVRPPAPPPDVPPVSRSIDRGG